VPTTLRAPKMSTLLSIPGVQTGFWINYDHGKVQGATLTLSARHGGYLIAFLAIYVSVTGSQVWMITRFILHQLNTRHENCEAFHAQQQLILRNSEGTVNTAWRVFQVSWAWRGLEPNSVSRSSHIIFLAFLFLATFLSWRNLFI
jgi:hypothetical protein